MRKTGLNLAIAAGFALALAACGSQAEPEAEATEAVEAATEPAETDEIVDERDQMEDVEDDGEDRTGPEDRSTPDAPTGPEDRMTANDAASAVQP